MDHQEGIRAEPGTRVLLLHRLQLEPQGLCTGDAGHQQCVQEG
ncbi:hypothetical protein ACFFX0_22035 [Citricoccus parietis]|uniref:Uncharacterized protein n=1 Tax=Citricoccus parietis TaxID=592307 RepID=A0ABV5G480_9MICC